MGDSGDFTQGTAKVWLITGTSSGFGLRLVTSVLARGDRVIATARSLTKLQQALQIAESKNRTASHNDHLRLLQLDVTAGTQAIKAKVDEAVAVWGRIDVLVNNAGSGLPGLLEEGGSALLCRQFEINVFGLMDVVTAVLPYMRARREGTVVNIGSRSVWRTGLHGIGPYAASKAAVHALTQTLSSELAPFNIRVLLVAPGSFRTEGIYSNTFYVPPTVTPPATTTTTTATMATATTTPSGPATESTDQIIPHASYASYDAMRAASIKRFGAVPGRERGDPVQAMEVVVDIVRGEGVVVKGSGAEGEGQRKGVSKEGGEGTNAGKQVAEKEKEGKRREWPEVLVLGEDAEQDVRESCKRLLGVLDEWGDVARSVSFADGE